MKRNKIELQSLPGPKDYEEAIAHLTSESDQCPGGIGTLIACYMERTQKHTWRNSRARATNRYLNRVALIGGLLEPVDSTGMSVDKEAHSSARAFISGAAVGAMISEPVHKGLVKIGEIIPVLAVCSDDELQARREIVGQVVELGGRGLKLMGSKAVASVEGWEIEMVKDGGVAKRGLFKFACGMAVLNAYNRAFAESANGRHSWDEELISLTSANKSPD